jgi:hypothetical protein
VPSVGGTVTGISSASAITARREAKCKNLRGA